MEIHVYETMLLRSFILWHRKCYVLHLHCVDIIEYKDSSFSYNISLFSFYIFFLFPTFLSYFRGYIIICFNIKLFFIYIHSPNIIDIYRTHSQHVYILQINEYIHHKDGNVFPFFYIPFFFLSFIPYTIHIPVVSYVYWTHYSFCFNHFHCIRMYVIGFMDPSPRCTYINCWKLHVYVRSTIPSHLPQRYGWLDIANKMGTKTWCWNVWVSGRFFIQTSSNSLIILLNLNVLIYRYPQYRSVAFLLV